MNSEIRGYKMTIVLDYFKSMGVIKEFRLEGFTIHIFDKLLNCVVKADKSLEHEDRKDGPRYIAMVYTEVLSLESASKIICKADQSDAVLHISIYPTIITPKIIK